MYAFTRIEFSNHRVALVVALTFAVYPILVRNSVSVRAEAPFVVFLLGAMVFLSLARKDGGTWHQAFAAGLCLTLAGMLRFEAWMLIPFRALVRWRKRRLAAVFVATLLNRTGLSRFFWHPPLAFLSLAVLMSSLVALFLVYP